MCIKTVSFMEFSREKKFASCHASKCQIYVGYMNVYVYQCAYSGIPVNLTCV